jgi:hypothetical protein
VKNIMSSTSPSNGPVTTVKTRELGDVTGVRNVAHSHDAEDTDAESLNVRRNLIYFPRCVQCGKSVEFDKEGRISKGYYELECSCSYHSNCFERIYSQGVCSCCQKTIVIHSYKLLDEIRNVSVAADIVLDSDSLSTVEVDTSCSPEATCNIVAPSAPECDDCNQELKIDTDSPVTYNRVAITLPPVGPRIQFGTYGLPVNSIQNVVVKHPVPPIPVGPRIQFGTYGMPVNSIQDAVVKPRKKNLGKPKHFHFVEITRDNCTCGALDDTQRSGDMPFHHRRGCRVRVGEIADGRGVVIPKDESIAITIEPGDVAPVAVPDSSVCGVPQVAAIELPIVRCLEAEEGEFGGPGDDGYMLNNFSSRNLQIRKKDFVPYDVPNMSVYGEEKFQKVFTNYPPMFIGLFWNSGSRRAFLPKCLVEPCIAYALTKEHTREGFALVQQHVRELMFNVRCKPEAYRLICELAPFAVWSAVDNESVHGLQRYVDGEYWNCMRCRQRWCGGVLCGVLILILLLALAIIGYELFKKYDS